MDMNKIFLVFFMGVLCLGQNPSSAWSRERDPKGDIHVYYYNDKAKLGMNAEEFNDVDGRSKKTYLVLEGDYKAVYRVDDPAQLSKYNFSDPYADSRVVDSVMQWDNSINLATISSNWKGINRTKGEGRAVLELPAGLYVVEYDDYVSGPTKTVYDYKGKHTLIYEGNDVQASLIVALYEGKHLFFTRDKKFSSNPNGVIMIYPKYKHLSVYGMPGAKSKLLPFDVLFREKSKNKRQTYLSPYSFREVRIFNDKSKFGFNMIHKPDMPGLGYLITYIEPKMHAWHSGLRAGDVIIAIKGMPDLTAGTAYGHLKEGKTLLVKQFETGEIKEIVLRKKQEEPINPMLFNSGYIR